MATLAPRMRRTAQNTQYSYNLNRRIHDVKTYHVLSPQGATILLYGHETGLTVVWRGGRRLKTPKPAGSQQQSGKGKQNGASEDAVMVLDSDDDDNNAPSASAAVPFVDKPEFEEASASDADGAYPDVVQTLDLALGTAVFHVAVLPMAPCAADDAGPPDILGEKMVFAVSCATKDVYVITLPLTPPSNESKQRPELRADPMSGYAGKGKWGEVLISLGGQSRCSDGLAVTLVKHSRPAASERGRSSDRTRSSSSPGTTRVVVAAHSREASGTLRLWDVAVDNRRAPQSDRPIEPFQTEYLPAPLTGVSFNPARSTQLLANASPHAVRIYDYSIPSIPLDDISEGPFPSQGSWLISLYPPFARGSLATTARKPIVAASWVCHGRAVLALLADGQWGIWDVDGAGPSPNGSSSTLFGKISSGVRGAALTAFSVSGQLEGTSPLRNPGGRKGGEGEFVPMTPHTRRDALASSFAGGAERLASVHGGMEVVQLPALRGAGGDESAVLWLGGADHIVSVIPGVARFWDAQVRRGAGGGVNLFSGAQPTRMIRLMDLGAGLMGERCCGVSAVARFPRRFGSEEESGGGHGAGEGLPIEVLVQGESRLVVVQESHADIATDLTARLLSTRKRKLGPAPVAEPASAIIVQPRPPKSATVSFDLSVNKRGSLRAPPPKPTAQENMLITPGSSFATTVPNSSQGDLHDDEVTMTQSMMMPPSALALRMSERGLGFAGDLENAANASDDEEAAEERNVEEELLDIMEIDRALEEMEGERGSGAKHVFFESE